MDPVIETLSGSITIREPAALEQAAPVDSVTVERLEQGVKDAIREAYRAAGREVTVSASFTRTNR